MTQAQIIIEAYKVGAEKLGTKTGQALGLTHEITELPVAGSGARVAAGAHPDLKPGQAYHCRGTTIANPQPSDIEVETARGKNIYDPKPDPRSKEEMVLKSTKLEQEIEGLKNTLQAILAGQNIAIQNAKPIVNYSKPVTESVTESEPSTAEITDTFDVMAETCTDHETNGQNSKPIAPTIELSMEHLRTMAKPYGIKTARMSKTDLVTAIRKAI